MILYVIGMSKKTETNDKNKNDPIVIDMINILVSTNMPDQKEISLTSKIIESTSPNASKYNEYPYITSSVKLKPGFLINKSRNDILDFFFIKDIFAKYTNIMGASNVERSEHKPTLIPEFKESDYEDADKESSNTENKTEASKRQIYEQRKDKYDAMKRAIERENEDKITNRTLEYITHNVEIMIQMLFDTYPIVGNVKSTLNNDYITKTYNVNKYSYLKIDSKDYTISKVIWINDIYNHYLSKQLLKDFKEFMAWKTGELRNILVTRTDNENQRDNIIKNIRDDRDIINNFTDDITKIGKYLMNPSNWINKTQSLITVRSAMEILYTHLIILQSAWEKDAIKNIKNSLKITYSDMEGKSKDASEPDGSKSSYSSITKSDYKDMQERIGNIMKSFDDRNYNYKQSKEFTIEMNRTANLVLSSNLVPLSTGVKNTIKDLNDNNEKRITLENNKKYIENDKIIMGNDKYNNENFKSLSGAFSKDVQMIKKIRNINQKTYPDFNYDNIMKLIGKLQKPGKFTINEVEDKFGIIYDNNNVTKPKYEIYMYIDLTEGKITDENKDYLDLCTFRDELLLLKFNQLVNNNNYTLQHDPLIKLLPTEKTKPGATDKKPEVRKAPVKGGAATRRVRVSPDNKQTKKNYIHA